MMNMNRRRNRASQNSQPTTMPPHFIPSENQGTEVKMGGQSKAPSNAQSNNLYIGHGGPINAPQPDKNVKAVDPGAIFPCINRYAYIWPNRGRGYWMYITYVGPRSIAGWVYDGRRWMYYGVDLRRIRKFYCY